MEEATLHPALLAHLKYRVDRVMDAATSAFATKIYLPLTYMMRRSDLATPRSVCSFIPRGRPVFSNPMPSKKKAKRASRKGTKKRTKRKAVKRGPGRRLTSADQKRRLDALKKHGSKDSPEPLTAKEIVNKLGINVGAWNVWKSNQKKGASVRSTRQRGRPRKAASSLDAVVAGFREIERERDQLRKVLEKVLKALAELR